MTYPINNLCIFSLAAFFSCAQTLKYFREKPSKKPDKFATETSAKIYKTENPRDSRMQLLCKTNGPK